MTPPGSTLPTPKLGDYESPYLKRRRPQKRFPHISTSLNAGIFAVERLKSQLLRYLRIK
jgi:hypothetical protein